MADNTSDDATALDPKKQSGRDKLKQPSSTEGGEDESSTEKEGDDSHLHDDQKSRTLPM